MPEGSAFHSFETQWEKQRWPQSFCSNTGDTKCLIWQTSVRQVLGQRSMCVPPGADKTKARLSGSGKSSSGAPAHIRHGHHTVTFPLLWHKSPWNIILLDLITGPLLSLHSAQTALLQAPLPPKRSDCEINNRMASEPCGPVMSVGAFVPAFNNTTTVHLSCAHQCPERSHDTY